MRSPPLKSLLLLPLLLLTTAAASALAKIDSSPPVEALQPTETLLAEAEAATTTTGRRRHKHSPVYASATELLTPQREEEAAADTQDPSFIGKLKVLNLNTWGLSWPWSQDRIYRFKALKEILALSNYDIILLQEVWYKHDYEIIRKSVPYITYFESFNAGCTSLWMPLGCSGLAIFSRHPIERVEFRPFSRRGSFWNFDGEIFVSKGVARASVRWRGLSVDVFTTHLVSYTHSPADDNSQYRLLQSLETARYISQSDADVKIFGGDLNTLPLKGEEAAVAKPEGKVAKPKPYAILSNLMTDALIDRYPDASMHPWFATFGNVRNTYTGAQNSKPERIDYLFYKCKPGIAMRTEDFVMPMFMTRNRYEQLISLSDHEALHAEFWVGLDNNNNNSYDRLDVDPSTNAILSNSIERRTSLVNETEDSHEQPVETTTTTAVSVPPAEQPRGFSGGGGGGMYYHQTFFGKPNSLKEEWTSSVPWSPSHSRLSSWRQSGLAASRRRRA